MTPNLISSLEQSRFTPGQTLSKMPNRYPDNYPKVLTNGFKGCVWAEDGRKFIDLISGLGAISVGYAHPSINLAVEEQIERGVSFSLPTRLEWEAAETLTHLITDTEMWKFGKTGTDGVLMAIRAARAYTGRTKILTSGYHGCSDHFECLRNRKAGMIDLKDFTHKWGGVLDYSDESYAAVVLEPLILEQEITQEIRNWCNETGALLIADEVVTGGRFEGFTASNHIKIEPDLYVLGKGLANGFPLCAVGGTRRIMSTFERDDFFASGTFNGETVSLAAFMATQEVLVREIPQMIEKGNKIKKTFNETFEYWNIKCVGYPTRLDFQFNCVTDRYKFWQEMCKKGILVGYNNFIMADHTNEEVNYICQMIKQVAKDFDKVELEGPLPISAVRN